MFNPLKKEEHKEKEKCKMIPFRNYQFQKEEDAALECFKFFAEQFPESFQDYETTAYGTFYDVMALSKTGQIENVELKLRKEGTDKFDGCFIEPKKWCNLLTDWREKGKLPIYINFVGDKKSVYVWQLNNVKNAQWKANITVGKGEYQDVVDRIVLDWKDAWHYEYDEYKNKYKLISKGL